jgi:hypothetical protein
LGKIAHFGLSRMAGVERKVKNPVDL